ncbi:MAG: DUF2304 domain-containing protein [Nanoarchaeota archaeon]
MIGGIQIVGVIFALLMFYITFLHQKRKEFTAKEYVFWAGLWAVVLAITLFPTSLDFLVKDILDLKRPIDFFIIVGFMFVIGLIFYMYLILRKTQNRIEEVVRAIARQKRR